MILTKMLVSFKTECTIILKVPYQPPDPSSNINRGEVDSGSILDQKAATKSYWEGRMIAAGMEETDQGWETVANVRFQPLEQTEPSVVPTTVSPTPEFLPAPPPQFDNSPLQSLDLEVEENKPTQQYMYGLDDGTINMKKKPSSIRVVETSSKKASSQENLIESEIREHQKRELVIRQETEALRITPRDKGASSPASHDSDEGFVDRHPVEDMGSTPPMMETPPLAESPTALIPPPIIGGFAQTHRVDPGIYEAMSAKPQNPSFDRPSSETKIAIEIRELREREEELRRMREQMSASRENILEDDDDDDGSNASARDHLMDDHLTSITTTTDEGNFSECGDPASSEEKSSDGSNSRITSPDLHSSYPPRKSVSVKPFEDLEEEEQPVYTRMKKESVIEREIRIAREREEAYRREKGLLQQSTGTATVSKASPRTSTPSAASTPTPDDPRDVQHRIATSRIQQEINQTSKREKELVIAGKILTLSEDTVDSKVTRMSDLAELSQSFESRLRPSSSASMSSDSSRTSVTSPINSPVTPINKRSSSPISPSYSPFSPTQFTPSPIQNGTSRLTRSLSTNNLSSGNTGIRAPKGLMQKFIASRGKLSTSAFGASPVVNGSSMSPSNKGVPTRPMKVESKSKVLQKESWHQQPSPAPAEPTKTPYRRANLTAEEKIQEELKEMQRREEELKRERARCLARSQPNLVDLDNDMEDEEDCSSSGGFTEGNAYVSSSTYRHEANMRAAHSNPNLLEDDSEPQQVSAYDKSTRRRSALIAQWENRIQQTTES